VRPPMTGKESPLLKSGFSPTCSGTEGKRVQLHCLTEKRTETRRADHHIGQLRVVRRCLSAGPNGYGSTLEIDHIISLELGGSNDIANLYPEKASLPAGAPGFHIKDKLENELHDIVCDGTMARRSARPTGRRPTSSRSAAPAGAPCRP
jgi:hypothetical protein